MRQLNEYETILVRRALVLLSAATDNIRDSQRCAQLSVEFDRDYRAHEMTIEDEQREKFKEVNE